MNILPKEKEMKNGLNSTSFGGVGLLVIMMVLLLLSGCSLFETKADSSIKELCDKYERQETLVQKVSQKRLQIADDFHRDRAQVHSRVATD